MKRVVIVLALLLAAPALGKPTDTENDKDYGVMSALKELGKVIVGPNFSKVRPQLSPGSGQRLPLTSDKDAKASPGQFARAAQFDKAKVR